MDETSSTLCRVAYVGTNIIMNLFSNESKLPYLQQVSAAPGRLITCMQVLFLKSQWTRRYVH